jgi:predicted dehydrogenase
VREEPLRVGVMGCANIAHKNVRAIARVPRAARVVAVASREASKAERFAARHGLLNSRRGAPARVYASYASLLADERVEAVYIPLPTALHAEWVARAAAAGKHVLVEKPVALNEAEMEAMAAACAEAGVVLQDGTMFTFDARWERVDAEVARIAPVRHVSACFCFAGDTDFRAGNIRVDPSLDALGCLGDVGWYAVRAALRVYGWRAPMRLTAHGHARRNAAGVLVACGATLDFGGGQTACVECAFDRALTQRVEILGEDGAISMEDAFVPHKPQSSSYSLVRRKQHAYHQLLRRASFDHSTHTISSCGVPQESAMWASFAAACTEPRGEVAVAAAARARLTQRVVCAIDESLRSSPPRTVDVRAL